MGDVHDFLYWSRDDNPLVGQHGDAIGQRNQRIQIVSDHDYREMQLSMKLANELDEGFAAFRVQPCRRLVQKDNPGLERERTGQRRSFDHAARELGWHFAAVGSAQAHHLQPLQRRLTDELLIERAQLPQWKSNVFSDGQRGKQSAALEQYPRVTPERVVGGAASSCRLEIVNAQTSDAGGYSVVVSNSYGSVTSAVATADRHPAAPMIVTQPTDQTIMIGQDATFTVGASGTAPLAYQWYYNTNTLLAGRTNNVLLITNAQSIDAGAYLVIVTNSLGSATSAVANLTVSTGVPLSAYNLAGFAQGTTGGGVLADTDPGYRKIYNAVDLASGAQRQERHRESARDHERPRPGL